MTTLATATLAASGWDASDVTTLAVAIVVPTVTVALTLWHQRRMLVAQQRGERRREAVAAVGPVYGLLSDCEPYRVVLSTGQGESSPDTAPAFVGELEQRWETQVRPPIGAIAAGFPSEGERELAAQLLTAVRNCIDSCRELAMALVRRAHDPSRATIDRLDLDGLPARLEGDHNQATQLLNKLAAAIRAHG